MLLPHSQQRCRQYLSPAPWLQYRNTCCTRLCALLWARAHPLRPCRPPRSAQHCGAAVGSNLIRCGRLCSGRHCTWEPAVRLCSQRAPAAGGG